MVVRVSRVAVPSVMVGVLGFAVAAATWPGNEPQTAYPAPAASQPLAAVDSPSTIREQNPRRTASPTPTAKPSPSRKATKVKAKPKAKPEATAKPKPKAVAKPAPKPAPKPPLKVVDSKYVTASLNVRTGPSFESDVVDVVSVGDKVSVTSAIHNGFRFISYNDRGRWISNKYLSDKRPAVQSSGGGSTTSGGISSSSCSKSSSIESGLVPNAIKVYRAICDRYPQVSSFGGRRSSGGFHGTGQAVDVMISNSSVGWDIANWTRANAGKLGVSEVIYYQKIWTVERSSEGWRPMSDRGSASANHYDHVHVSVY
jgi:uncharacterized protein YgiM (DUF1202 family)